MPLNAHVINQQKTSASWRARAPASDKSHWVALNIAFFFMYIQRHLDFFCIFVFNQGVPVVVVLRMSLATALHIPIIITPARFCAVSSVPSSFLSDFGPPKFVDVGSVVAEDRISSSLSRARTSSCSLRAQSALAILLTLRDSIAHSEHIEKITKPNRFYQGQTLK